MNSWTWSPQSMLLVAASLLLGPGAWAAPGADSQLQAALVDRCCQVGRERAAESAKFGCKLGAREALGAGRQASSGGGRLEALLSRDPKLGEQCELVLESCCLGYHRSRNCQSGKQFAKSGAACMDVELSREFTVATESFNDCCMACSLGVLAARSPPPLNETTSGRLANRCRLASPLASSLAGQLYEQTYVECCQESLPRLSGALLEPGAPIDCSQPTSACSQRCLAGSGRHQPDRCDCFAGYKLASDQTSCLDVDECRLNLHTCQRDSEVCDNVPGSFRCLARRSSASSASLQMEEPQLAAFASARLCPLGWRWSEAEGRCQGQEQASLEQPARSAKLVSSSSSSSSFSSFRQARSSSSSSRSSAQRQQQQV